MAIREAEGEVGGLLKSLFNHEPDVVILGEIRRLEDIETAMEAARAGQLAVITVQANDSVGAMDRLLELGVEPSVLATEIVAILAYGIVRRICQRCRVPFGVAPPPPSCLPGSQSEGGLQTWYGRGCEACLDTGYHGLKGLFELMPVQDSIGGLTQPGASTSRLLSLSRLFRLDDLYAQALRMISAGETTFEEALTACFPLFEQNARIESFHRSAQKVRRPSGERVMVAGTEPLIQGQSGIHFTPRARIALELAASEALSFHHDVIEPEHLLLGLIRLRDGVAGRVLKRLGVELDAARREVENWIGRGDCIGKIHWSAGTNEAFNLAAAEVRALDHHFVGTEHLLLGLLGGHDGGASRVLRCLNVAPVQVKAVLMRELVAGALSGRSMPFPGVVPFSKYTTRALKAILLAYGEAERSRGGLFGSEHLLCGLIKIETGPAPEVLRRHGLSLELIRQEMQKEPVSDSSQRPYLLELAPSLHEALGRAAVEADALKHPYLGTEHLLLGLLRENDGAASRIFNALKVLRTKIRGEILDVIGPNRLADPLKQLREWLSVQVRPRYVTLKLTAAELSAGAVVTRQKRLEEIQRKKEAAIKAQDFVASAELREQERRLKAELDELTPKRSEEPGKGLEGNRE